MAEKKVRFAVVGTGFGANVHVPAPMKCQEGMDAVRLSHKERRWVNLPLEKQTPSNA